MQDLGNKVVIGVLFTCILVLVAFLGVKLLVEDLATLVQLNGKVQFDEFSFNNLSIPFTNKK